MLRLDDLGMCHTVNLAARQVIETGVPFSASVMFACPWYQEAVEMLRKAPQVSVGIHLTLNAEWKNYRWGPVAGAGTVPSLVDSNGYFFPSRALFFANGPRIDEVEHELRSQINRSLASGLEIDYIDYHMGTAVDTPELRSLVERLSEEYGLGISRYFGEQDVNGLYTSPIDRKSDTLMSLTTTLSRDTLWLMVFHVGLTTPEMSALVDLNTFGLSEMAAHRQGELGALTSERFQQFLHCSDLQILTYRDLIQQAGLGSMIRPDPGY
jgi:predicted glycoside hydrolase/deacetylase ChbG (UPF0249 family)